jgi:predicted HAD superfamily Cof-like phosphohydrolase
MAPDFHACDLRLALIREEFIELEKAVRERNMVDAADALADITYVVLGAALAWGVDLPAVFEEVHAANMRKIGGPVREDGKKLKPPGWEGPDIAGVLEKQKTGGSSRH